MKDCDFRLTGISLVVATVSNYAFYKARGWYDRFKEYRKKKNQPTPMPSISGTISQNTPALTPRTRSVSNANKVASVSGCDANLPGMVPEDIFLNNAVPDGEVPDVEVPDSEVPDGEVPDGEVPEGEVLDSQVPVDEVHEGQVSVNAYSTTTTIRSSTTQKDRDSPIQNNLLQDGVVLDSVVLPIQKMLPPPTFRIEMINNQVHNAEVVKSNIYSLLLFLLVPLTCAVLIFVIYFVQVEFLQILVPFWLYFMMSIILPLPIYFGNSSLRNFTLTNMKEMINQN